MLRFGPPLAALAVVLVGGCEFFSPPEPTPADDTVLTCGETLVVDDVVRLSTGWEIDAATGTGLEVSTAFDDPSDSIRLVYEDDSGIERATGFTDPTTGERLFTGFMLSGRRAFVEFLWGSSAPSGSLTLTCTTPGENCGNLADDDGDGAIDCADSHCARDADCLEGQRDFDLSALGCTDGWEPLEVPELRSFSSQRTIYRLEDDEGDFREEFWGGAETSIVSAVLDRFVQVRSQSGGLACLGTDVTTHIACIGDWARLGGDAVFVVADADLPVHLEPAGAAWTDLEVRVDCGSDD